MKYANGKSVATEPLAQEQAADPTRRLAATFDWAWRQRPERPAPDEHRAPAGTMTKGAIMAFENAHGSTTDGVACMTVSWRDLINDIDANKVSTFGYTFVSVSEGSPETESTWHSGKTVVSGLVNTATPAAPTAQGAFRCSEDNVLVTTMTGLNPDVAATTAGSGASSG